MNLPPVLKNIIIDYLIGDKKYWLERKTKVIQELEDKINNYDIIYENNVLFGYRNRKFMEFYEYILETPYYIRPSMLKNKRRKCRMRWSFHH